MKIVVVSPSGSFGGAERLMVDLVRDQGKAGLDIRPVVLQAGPLTARLRALEADVTLLEAGRLRDVRRFTRTVRSLRQLIQRYRPDLVVSNLAKAHVYVSSSTLGLGVPTAWWQAGVPTDPHWTDRLASALPASAVFVTTRAATEAQDRIWRSPRPILIPLGVDCVSFSPDVEPSPDVTARRGKGRLLAGVVGRIDEQKGIRLFLQAVSLVDGVDPVVVGSADATHRRHEEDLRALAASLGWKPDDVFLGERRDIPAVLTALDLVVSASQREGFGLSIVEAMAAARPVVASAHGGPLEYIQDGVNGVLVTDYSAIGFARAIEVLCDGTRRQQIGSAARLTAQSELNLEYVVKRFATACSIAATWVSGAETRRPSREGVRKSPPRQPTKPLHPK